MSAWHTGTTPVTPPPYAQLASALTALGDRDAANEIPYLGHVRERENEKRLAWVWSVALQYVAPVSGSTLFHVLYWVLGISVLSALYLRTRVQRVRDKNHGLFWCFGASLVRLLPVIEINKDFKDFFDNPYSRNTNRLAEFYFFRYGIVGWALAAILIAAMSGLNQSS